MQIKNITQKEREEFNSIATHPLQSYEWGEFREKTGVKVIRRGFYEGNKIVAGFQLTIHKVPKTHWTIGYLPKGTIPTKEMLEELVKIGKENKCIFIQLEPNIEKNHESRIMNQGFETIIHNSKFVIPPSAHPLFTKYTFQLDLTKSEDELLKQMHSKTRYNVRVAQKHDVEVKEEHSENAFKEYLKLTEQTTKRQGFFAHTKKYHELMWESLRTQVSVFGSQFSDSSQSVFSSSVTEKPITGKLNSENRKLKTDNRNPDNNNLTAHLLLAYYTPPSAPHPLSLTTWVLFVFHDTLYYPYGASSSEYRETMSSNLMMWEAIKFGKKLGLKTFDMWGSLGENPDPKDSWYGFHRFKMGYGPKLVKFVGSYDLVINPIGYQLYKAANKLRWLLLRLNK